MRRSWSSVQALGPRRTSFSLSSRPLASMNSQRSLHLSCGFFQPLLSFGKWEPYSLLSQLQGLLGSNKELVGSTRSWWVAKPTDDQNWMCLAWWGTHCSCLCTSPCCSGLFNPTCFLLSGSPTQPHVPCLPAPNPPKVLFYSFLWAYHMRPWPSLWESRGCKRPALAPCSVVKYW